MSNDIETQKLYDTWRRSLLQFVTLDYIIRDNVNKMELLPVATNTLSTPPVTLTSNDIKNPYWIEKNIIMSIYNLPQNLVSKFLEEEFNKNNISRELFQTIRSFGLLDQQQADLVQAIRLYIDYRLAIFIQQLLSYVLLYPDILNEFQKMDDRTRLDTVRSNVKRITNDLHEFEVTYIILYLIDTFGKIKTPTTPLTNPGVDENLLKVLLTPINPPPPATPTNWNAITPATWGPGGIALAASLDEAFKLLSNLLKVHVKTAIPIGTQLTAATNVAPPNDVIEISVDLGKLEAVNEIWRSIFVRNENSPVVIDYLRNELPKIYEHFEKSKAASGMEQYIALSKNVVREFLQAALSSNKETKLNDIYNQPSSEALIDNFRSLQLETPTNPDNLPTFEQLNFLFCVWWLLTETPILADFHTRAENYFNPGSPRLTYSQQIFPDIIDKEISDRMVVTVSLERMFNNRKKNFEELNKQIMGPEGLNNVLLKARGISL